MKRVLCKLFVALAVLATAVLYRPSDAVALVQTFFGEDLNPGATVPPGGNADIARQNFLSALSAGVSTEDFESFTGGSVAPLALTFAGGLGTINGTLSGNGTLQSVPIAGRFATSGSQYWNITGSQAAAGGFTVSFASPIAAFGFFATDVGDFNSNLTVDIGNGPVVVPNTVLGPNASLLFYGVIDTDNPFTSVVLGTTAQGADAFGFDDLTVGDVAQVSQVPLPAAFPLFLLALSALGFFGFRRSRRRAGAA